ncbi:VOC family protein [Oryzifoliimicrobium ureilyticus]|uniref:VOC family protein n=1 Tax=Oryzifoliimicrobium ureilyticus TaxID=3113724 RepID=UPI0030768810
MLHHLSFGVSDIQMAAVFYDAVLQPLGFVRVWEDLTPGNPDHAVGYGQAGGGDKFTLKQRDAAHAPGAGFHLAFSAPSRQAVVDFHEAGLSHGGRDNGKPGLRPDYGSSYFAAFLIDPNGYAIEAVHKG